MIQVSHSFQGIYYYYAQPLIIPMKLASFLCAPMHASHLQAWVVHHFQQQRLIFSWALERSYNTYNLRLSCRINLFTDLLLVLIKLQILVDFLLFSGYLINKFFEMTCTWFIQNIKFFPVYFLNCTLINTFTTIMFSLMSNCIYYTTHQSYHPELDTKLLNKYLYPYKKNTFCHFYYQIMLMNFVLRVKFLQHLLYSLFSLEAWRCEDLFSIIFPGLLLLIKE